MSWLGTLAARTENLLNKVDQVAGQALHKESGPEDDLSSPWLPPQKFPEASRDYSPFLGTQKQNKSSLNAVEEGGKKQKMSLKTSQSNLSQKPNDRQTQEETTATKGVPGSKDADSELFEFLNNSSESDVLSKKDSRPPSVSSNRSTHSRKTPDHPESTFGVTVTNESSLRSDGAGNGITSSSSNNYPPDEVKQEVQQHHSSSLETENQLLKNEIMSLNREMESAIRRIQSTQEELNQIQKKLDRQAGQLSKSEQMARELQSRESDMQEALNVKDSQLSLLRKRLDEADQALTALRKQIAELQVERDSILKDQSLSTDVQGHALDTLQDKLNEAEAALRHQQELFHRTEDESTARQTKLESDKQMLMTEVSTLQKNLNTEKAANADLSSQLRNARTQTEAAKNELTEYKDKAQRILQSKDRLITSLKEGSGGSGSGETMVHATELDSMRQERDIVREELQNSQLALENLRSELAELENQMQQDSETSRDQIASLEDQLHMERKRREDGELEMNKVKQELRFVHEEFIKQKSAFQTRLQDRENEISRLRNQLTTKSTNATSQEELENRLHSLTESLIQKQTTLEALSTEKNSLVLQLERMEKQYHEAEASALRATAAAAITINDDESDVRPRGGGGFMNESPLDGNVTRRVKFAANTIDRFSIRLGLFLRRYPIARIFIIVYMGLLHLWVMIVLLTYEPEIHTSHTLPHA